jgi:hypothetical protein
LAEKQVEIPAPPPANQGRSNFPTTTGVLTAVTGSEARKLQELALGRVVLELGALHGYSTLVLASTASQVWSVDWHFGDGDAQFQETWESFGRNTRAARHAGQVIAVAGRFDRVLPHLQPAMFEGLFHDGAHDERSVAADLRLALPLLSWDAWIAVHDWGLFGVTPACLGVLGPPTLTVGHLAVWEKARAALQVG